MKGPGRERDGTQSWKLVEWRGLVFSPANGAVAVSRDPGFGGVYDEILSVSEARLWSNRRRFSAVPRATAAPGNIWCEDLAGPGRVLCPTRRSTPGHFEPCPPQELHDAAIEL